MPCVRHDGVGIRNALRGIAIGICVLSVSFPTWAQPAKPPAAKPKDGEKKEEKKPPPEPERSSFETSDGWKIHYTYYGPQEDIRDGKETVPLIMVHDWGGQGNDYSLLAAGLQTYGHASIVLDLRGHGRSITRFKPIDRVPETVKYDDRRKFTLQDRQKIWLDLEGAKEVIRGTAGQVKTF